MAIVVETGVGLANADALISVAYADTYHARIGNAAWAGADEVKEPAIVRATSFLSNAYVWQGLRRRGRDQALAWPRTQVFDQEGYSVAFDAIPTEVQQAVAEIALRELAAPGAMTPDYTPSERVKREQFGPVAFDYDLSRTDAESVRPVLLVVRDLIGPLLGPGRGSNIQGSAVRI